MRGPRPIDVPASLERDAAAFAVAPSPAADNPAGTRLRNAAVPGPNADSCPAGLLSLRGDIPDGEQPSHRHNAGNRIVPDLSTHNLPVAIATVLCIVLLLGGCQERLAQRDTYFAPLRGLSVSLHAETEHVLDYHQAMQAALHGCNESQRATATSSVMGPVNVVPEGALDLDAQVRLCASSGIAHAAHGAPLNGYWRWVGDQVRELPAPSETASSIGGGS